MRDTCRSASGPLRLARRVQALLERVEDVVLRAAFHRREETESRTCRDTPRSTCAAARVRRVVSASSPAPACSPRRRRRSFCRGVRRDRDARAAAPAARPALAAVDRAVIAACSSSSWRTALAPRRVRRPTASLSKTQPSASTKPSTIARVQVSAIVTGVPARIHALPFDPHLATRSPLPASVNSAASACRRVVRMSNDRRRATLSGGGRR